MIRSALGRQARHRLHVLFADPAQLFVAIVPGTDFRERGRVGAADAPRKIRHFPQFAGAEHFRVACEYLLDQRGARARHADDEYGRGGGIAEAALAAQHLGREHAANSFEALQRLLLVVNHLLPFERVAAKKVLERSLVIADVGERLAERKMQIDLLFAVERIDVFGKFLHRREVTVIAGKTPDAG